MIFRAPAKNDDGFATKVSSDNQAKKRIRVKKSNQESLLVCVPRVPYLHLFGTISGSDHDENVH